MRGYKHALKEEIFYKFCSCTEMLGNCFGIENAAVLRVWLELFFRLFYPHVQECHLLVLNASGQVTSRVVLHPSVDSSGYIVKVRC